MGPINLVLSDEVGTAPCTRPALCVPTSELVVHPPRAASTIKRLTDFSMVHLHSGTRYRNRGTLTCSWSGCRISPVNEQVPRSTEASTLTTLCHGRDRRALL